MFTGKIQNGWSMPAIGTLLVLVIAGPNPPRAHAAPDKPAATAMYRTDHPIRIDGILDEECWQHAIPISVNYLWGRGGEASAEPRMNAWYTWDERFLYIAYETFDANLVAKGTGRFSGPPDNQRESCEIAADDRPVDVVEFFIGFNDPHMFWEVHHTAANHFSDILVFARLPGWQPERPAIAAANIYWAAHEFIRDDGEFKLATAARLKPRADGEPSTINDDTDVDSGYIGELRLPWAGLGAPVTARSPDGWAKLAGREIAILAVVQNGDLEERYHTSSATLPRGDFFHNNFARWPRYTLESSTRQEQ